MRRTSFFSGRIKPVCRVRARKILKYSCKTKILLVKKVFFWYTENNK